MGEKGFQPGNQAAAGHRGNNRPDICTQALISQLNEIDKKTGKEKIHLLVEQLIKLALGYERKVKSIDTKGKTKTATVEVPPDIMAIKEVIDRVQGKAPQALEMLGGDVHITIIGGLPRQLADENGQVIELRPNTQQLKLVEGSKV